jgi:signal transduction histidine kinase
MVASYLCMMGPLKSRSVVGWRRICLGLGLILCLYPGRIPAQLATVHSKQEWPGPFLRTGDTSDIYNDIEYVQRLILDSKQIDTAIIILERTIAASIGWDYNYGLVRSFFHLGSCYQKKGRYEDALGAFRKSIRYASQPSYFRFNIPNVYNSMGNTYYSMGMYDMAVSTYYRILTLSSAQSDHRVIAGAYNNLSVVFSQLGRYEPSLFYLEKAEQAARKRKDYDLLARIYYNRAEIYGKAGDSVKKEQDIRTSMAYAQKGTHEATRRFLLVVTGRLHLWKGQYDQARHYLERALRSEEDMAPHHLNAIIVDKAIVAYHLGAYKEAERYLLQAATNCRDHNLTEGMMEIEQHLSNVYRAMGQLEQALTHQDAYMRLKDSTQQGGAAWRIHQLDLKYRTAEKEKDLAVKQLLINEQKRKLQQKNMWIVGSFLGIGMLIALLFGIYRNAHHKDRLHAEQLRTMKQESEIALLQAIMKGEERQRVRFANELHDGISSQLSAMKMFISSILKRNIEEETDNELRQLRHMVKEVAEEVRKTAHNLMPEGLKRQGLAEAVRTFCEQISRGGTTRIELYTYGDFSRLDNDFVLFLYRTVQELVHNIVKHAQASRALVLMTSREDMVCLTIEDDGVGMQMSPSEAEEGFGLAGIQRRIDALSGTMIVESLPGKGTSICIELPFVRKGLRVMNT